MALVLIVEITDIKYGHLSKNLFQRTQQQGNCKNALGKDKFVQRIVSSNYHIESKTLIEASFTDNTHTLGKFFAVATFEVCQTFVFRQSEKKTGGIIWFVRVFFVFYRREDQINAVYEK